MSVNTLQLFSQQTNGVTYCDPSSPDYIVRFKSTSSQKVLDGKKVQNVIAEITANDNYSVVVGDASVTDALSVRIRTSGSIPSMPRLKQMLLDLAGKVDTWSTENVLIGFKPSTPPINTVE